MGVKMEVKMGVKRYAQDVSIWRKSIVHFYFHEHGLFTSIFTPMSEANLLPLN